MKTDSIFYRLFLEFPRAFFELISQPAIEPSAYRFTSVEIKQTSFRIDGVFLPAVESPDLPIYFVEVQFQLDEQLYRRLFSEIFLYLRQNETAKHWRAIAIYAKRSLEPSDTLPYQALLGSNQVQRLYLDELGDGEPASLGIEVVKLVVEAEETAVEKARRLMERSRQEVADEASQRKILDLIETVVFYKFSKLSREEVAKMLGLDEFKQSRLYREMREEIEQEVKQEAEQEIKLNAVPRLLALGLSVEQVAGALDLTVEQVRQAAQPPSD